MYCVLFSGFCELLDPNYGAATTGQEKWQCVEKGGRRPKRRRPHAALVFSQRRASFSESKGGEEELFIRRRAETATEAEETRPMDVMIHDPDSDSLKLEAATGRRREEQGKKRVDYDHGNDRRGTPGAMGTEAGPGLFFASPGLPRGSNSVFPMSSCACVKINCTLDRAEERRGRISIRRRRSE